MIWPHLDANDVRRLQRVAVAPDTLTEAARIVDDVRRRGEAAVREWAVRFAEVGEGDELLITRDGLENALTRVTVEDRRLLQRTADRISTFARAQRDCLSDLHTEIDGGSAGHRVDAVERAGCYAPGGRYPLPSSVLMTAVTARVAGVEEVWVASPRPTTTTLAAAAIAGADGVLAVGGAHAIAALAYGLGSMSGCEVVVGPGNRWVTAAKQLVAGRVGIDMLAGPSELVVLADDSADASVVAADLLAQAEHDPDALPVLVTTSKGLADEVAEAIEAQLEGLPTREVAEAALARGFRVVADNLRAAIDVCDRLAPEHLQVMTEDASEVAARLRHWGGLFIGTGSAEVLGDYGAGPNHTLPTGGVARYQGGLSVFDFLRIRTWMEVDDLAAARPVVEDAVRLARMEGLEAHARAAERRLESDGVPQGGEIADNAERRR